LFRHFLARFLWKTKYYSQSEAMLRHSTMLTSSKSGKDGWANCGFTN
jgi:hypothetical protein